MPSGSISHANGVDASATASHIRASDESNERDGHATALAAVVHWPNARGGYDKGPRAIETENAMIALFQLEASQSVGGKTYRLTVGLFMPQLASIVALLSQLF
jgi:hypothetical protein